MNVIGMGTANWLKGSGTLLLSRRSSSTAISTIAKTTSIASISRPNKFSLQPPINYFSTFNCENISNNWNKQNIKLQIKCYCNAASPSSNVNVPEKDGSTTEVKLDGSSEVPEEDEEAKLRKIKDAANVLDIRVGRVLKAWRHEEADSLYVEEVDVGEAEPRIICSGLVKYVPIEHLQERNVVVLANLKPRNMRGVKSNGMLMAASDASHENVELLEPPEGSVPGERVWFGSADEKENLPDVVTPNQVQKKKIWELVQPHLKTDGACVAALGTHGMRTSTGVVVSRSLKDATIS